MDNVFKVEKGGSHVLRRHGWYIKFYFIEPETWFLSVHQ